MSSQTRSPRPNKHRAERIIAGFEADNNQWRMSNEIGVYIPGDNASIRYNTIYTMSSCVPPLLEKQPYMNGTHRYRLAPGYKEAMHSLFPSLPAIKALVGTLPTDGVDPVSRMVRWDEGERDLMIEQVRELRRKYMGLTVLDAARKAQDILINQGLLDRSHRRPLNSQATIRFIIDALFNEDGTPKPDPADEPIVEEERILPPDVVVAEEKDATPEPAVPVSTAQVMVPSLGQMIDAFLPSLMDRVASRITQAIADGIAQGMERASSARAEPKAEPPNETWTRTTGAVERATVRDESDAVVTHVKPPKHDPTPPVSGERLKKVLIVGLYNDEISQIRKGFADTFDLRFWVPGAGSDLTALKNSAAAAQHAFILTNRIFNKGQENLVTKTGTPYTRITGNVDTVQDALTAFYVNEKP